MTLCCQCSETNRGCKSWDDIGIHAQDQLRAVDREPYQEQEDQELSAHRAICDLVPVVEHHDEQEIGSRPSDLPKAPEMLELLCHLLVLGAHRLQAFGAPARIAEVREREADHDLAPRPMSHYVY